MYEFMLGQESLKGKQPIMWRECQLRDQPIVAAPAYIGIVVFFIIILFIDERKIKYFFQELLLLPGKNFLH
jgi:hypothetical protein